MKLKPKILTLLLPATILPLIAFFLFCYIYISTNSHNALIYQLEQKLDLVESHVRTNFKEQSIFSKTSSTHPEVKQSFLKLEPTAKDSLNNLFRNFLTINEDLSLVAIIDQAGAIIHQTRHLNSPVISYIDLVKKIELEDSQTFLTTYIDQASEDVFNIVVQTIKTPYQDAYGETLWKQGYYLLAFKLSLTTLEEKGFHYDKNLPETIILITDKNGNKIYPKKTVNTLGDAAATVINSRHRAIKEYLTGDIHFHAGFHRLRENLYIVGIQPDEGKTYLATNLSTYAFIFIIIVVFATVLICFWYTSAVFITPLKRLSNSVKEVSEHKTPPHFDIEGDDEISELSRTFRDMSISLLESQEEINKLAFYDPLTSLPNKTTFDKALARGIEHSKNSHRALAVLVIDLDNFKLINDVHGHTAGDAIIKEVAGRLQNCLRHIEIDNQTVSNAPMFAQDMIIRNGGDEFSILLTDLFQAYQASLIAQRILDELKVPFVVDGTHVKLGASIGITLYPVDGMEPEELIKNADLAMFEAKKKGKNNFQFFTPALNASAAKRLQTENELRIAIEKKQFTLYYQPIVYARTGEICKVETLIRWNHPERGVILPNKFIPVAEESGQIMPLGNRVIDNAIEQLATWHRQGRNDLKICINMLSSQLIKGDIINVFKDALAKYQVQGEFVEIEVKEEILVHDQISCIETLKNLKELGISICLDDFGAGFGSLSFLNKFPLDSIKIDRSITKEITKDAKYLAIIKTACKLANELELTVSLSGVELESQLEAIADCKTDYVQGFLFAPPLPAEQISLEQTWEAPFKKKKAPILNLDE